jgi:hypothetical protein
MSHSKSLEEFLLVNCNSFWSSVVPLESLILRVRCGFLQLFVTLIIVCACTDDKAPVTGSAHATPPLSVRVAEKVVALGEGPPLAVGKLSAEGDQIKASDALLPDV